jgi:hypothetical protein
MAINLGQQLLQGAQVGQSFGFGDALRRGQEAEQSQALNLLAQRATQGDQAAINQLTAQDPKRLSGIQDVQANQQAQQNKIVERLARATTVAESITDPAERNTFLQGLKLEFQGNAEIAGEIDELIALPPQEQVNQFNLLQSQFAQAKDVFAPPSKASDQKLRERQIAVSEASLEERQSKLSAGLEGALLTAQDRTAVAQRNANQYTVLAGDFERLSADLQGGVKLTFSEGLKSILGTQDDVTEFRRQFNKVRLSEGLKNLPPGPATDKDVQEAFKGVPKENASPEQVASFLRGAARIARFEAGYNQFKGDFISSKRTAAGLNKEWRRQVESPKLKRKVSVAEIYETSQNRGITPEEVAQQLGLSDGFI